MVRIINFIIMFTCFSLFSCQSILNVKDRLLKKIENFDRESIGNVVFNRLYVREGVYKTKKDFDIIFPKLEVSTNGFYYDYLYIQGNGKLSFFTSSSRLIKNIENKESFNAVINKEKNKIIVYRLQVFHQIRGFDPSYGIYKQYLKVFGNKIYIQDGNDCSVYVLAE